MINGDSGLVMLSLANYKLGDGDKVYLTVKAAAADIKPVIKKEIAEFLDGNAHITIEPLDTLNLEPNNYVYDVQVNLSNGIVDTVIAPSKFTIIKGVTE